MNYRSAPSAAAKRTAMSDPIMPDASLPFPCPFPCPLPVPVGLAVWIGSVEIPESFAHVPDDFGASAANTISEH